MQNEEHLNVSPIAQKSNSRDELDLITGNMPSAALARLPPEIMSLIFFHSLPLQEPEADCMPHRPVVEEVPWSVGQVCSRWRQIVRSERCLWASMKFDLQVPSHAAALQHACILLPPFVSILLFVDSYTVPYTAEIDSLVVSHLGRVQSLNIQLSPSELDIFFRSVSRSPQCLSGLRFLRIEIIGTLISDEMAASWDSLAPLQNATCIKKFTLRHSPRFPLFTLHIPWSNLRSLSVGLEMGSAMSILRSCSGVEKLHLDISFPRKIQFDDPVDVIPPSVQKLVLGGFVSPSVLSSLKRLKSLKHLDVFDSDIDGDSLYEVLGNGPYLISLTTAIPKPPQRTPNLRKLSMPHLRKLKMYSVEDDWLLRILSPGILETFEIFNQYPYLDFAALREMIAPSAASLLSLTMSMGHRHDSSILFDLLSSLTLAISIRIHNTSLAQECIDGIAKGTLLPRLEMLDCSTFTTDVAFLCMVEARVTSASYVKGTLKTALGEVSRFELDGEERAERKLLLNKRAGVHSIVYEAPIML